MKKVRLLLGIGVLAAGTLALYFFAKKTVSATVQTMDPNEDSMKKEPSVSEEDRTILEETFGDSEVAEVTETNTQELYEKRLLWKQNPNRQLLLLRRQMRAGNSYGQSA